MKNIYLRLVLPTIFAILLFILTIFLVIIPRYKQNIMNGKREMIRELTKSALSILSKYENEEREGQLSSEEAKRTAASAIQYLRYGEEYKDYFWITDITPVMIMHPFRSDLNGKDLTDFRDPHGKRMFVEFVETVKRSGSGYVNYMWQWKDDSLQIVPKLSYVSIFKPWNWVIGTGVYTEDVRKEISSLTMWLIWISTAISILIAALLLFIIRQSISLDRKRIEAENELHRSREKLRTLVEAATEGLIMLIDGKISFSNSVISKFTGYNNDELINHSFSEIISRNNSRDLINTFSEKSIREGKYELNINRKNGGFIEALVTSSNTVFYEKAVNIIIVKDISIENNLSQSNIDYQKLLINQETGIFKARIDTKGKFLFANEIALKVMGFENHEDLSKAHFLEMIADPTERKNIRRDLKENGYLKNKVIKIFKKNCEHAIVNLSMVVLNNEDTDEMICDGIIEDITPLENEKKETSDLITELKSTAFILERPVKEFVTSVKTIDSDETLSEAIHQLDLNKTDALLLSKDDNDIIGIITNTDIQKRILALNIDLDNPAYLVMSSPVKYIRENASVIEAIVACEENIINHLIVRNESGEITGMLRITDIRKMAVNSLSFYIGNIGKAKTDNELRKYHNDLKKLIIPLIMSDVTVKFITNVTTSFSDAVTRRIIELRIKESGEPPVRFSFICLGSEGRKEETLFTDQDNAIIYEDPPKEKETAVKNYFLKLGQKVCDSLDYAGYSFCKGNIMAKNPQWCKPLTTWEKYFTGWINTPEPENLLEASVFFDFRTVYGDEEFTEKLRGIVSEYVRDNPLFLYHMAYHTFNTKTPHISQSILSERHPELIDLKSAIAPFIMFARTYSLKYDIAACNTIDRFLALKEKNIINESNSEEMLYSYRFLMKLRFRNQADQLKNGLQLSNLLDYGKMIDIELLLLKKILSYIPDIQNRIKTDFRIS